LRQVTVIPHGKLAELTAPLTIAAHDAIQAVTAFAHQVEGAEAVLRRGRFQIKTPKGYLMGDGLVAPLATDEMQLIPALEGGARGRGKAVLGLTLLGLSFVPGVNAGVGSAFASAGQAFGPAAATSFQQFGAQLLGRAGALTVLSGLAEVISPQVSTPAGVLPSSSIAAPAVSGQGAAIPLVYGEARITHPVVVSSGISVDVLR
jgi:predicted phage tail protein